MARKITTLEEFALMNIEDLEKLEEALLLEDGRIVTNPKKRGVCGLNGPKSLKEQVEDILENRIFKRALQDAGYETIDEANDFDIDDEPESIFNPPVPIVDLVEEKQPEVMRAELESENDDKEEKIMINGIKYVKSNETSEDIAEA